MLRQAHVFSVRAVNGHCSDELTRFDPAGAIAEAIHDADKIPSGCEGRQRRLRMNALARHDVRQ